MIADAHIHPKWHTCDARRILRSSLRHAPGFWAHIPGDERFTSDVSTRRRISNGEVPRLLRECPDLFADLSTGSGLTATSSDRGLGKGFHVEFQNRLLFGRDYSDARLMDYLNELDLPSEVVEKITSGNALRLLDHYLD